MTIKNFAKAYLKDTAKVRILCRSAGIDIKSQAMIIPQLSKDYEIMGLIPDAKALIIEVYE